MITFIILISIILGILLSPMFLVYKLGKKIDWRLLKGIYKDWLRS